MASFADLPNEVVIKILEKTLPTGIESLAAASKDVHRLAIPLLQEHRKLREEFTTRRQLSYHIPELLFEIHRDPRIALYVTEVRWGYWRKEWETPNGIDESVNYCSPLRRSMFQRPSSAELEQLIHAVEIFPADEKQDWIAAIHAGYEEPLAALLLLHLPNLRWLTWNPFFPQHRGMILSILQKIGEGDKQSHLLQLETLLIRCDQKWSDSNLVSTFMSIPSLKNLLVSGFWMQNDERCVDHLLRMKVSNIEKLGFDDCGFVQKVLCAMVNKTRFLKTFTWKGFPAIEGDVFDSASLRHALVANAGLTLQRLKLGSSGHDCIPLGSLRELVCLYELDVDVAFLFSSDGSDISIWPSKLPQNLRKLSLTLEDNHEMGKADHIMQTPENFCEAFRCLLRTKKSQTPHLKDILIRMQSAEHCREAYDHVKFPVSRAGILFHHSHPSGSGHIAPSSGKCQDCKAVVERFLQETGGPVTEVTNEAWDPCCCKPTTCADDPK